MMRENGVWCNQNLEDRIVSGFSLGLQGRECGNEVSLESK